MRGVYADSPQRGRAAQVIARAGLLTQAVGLTLVVTVVVVVELIVLRERDLSP